MLKKGAVILSLLVLWCTLAFGCRKPAASSQKPLKICYMICNSLPESRARFEPITAYLAEQLKRPVESIYLNTQDVEAAVQKKEIDFTHTNSILYVIFKERYQAVPLTGEIRGRYGNKDAGTIIASRKSGIKTIQDLKGKSMIFGPSLAPMGFLAQYDLMLKAGINPDEDLAFYNIPGGSWKHEKVIYGVLFGAYDAGAAPRIDLDQMAEEGKIDLNDFTIVAESEPIAYCTFAALSHVDPQLVQKVKSLLVGITQEDSSLVGGEVVKILKSAGLERFVEVKDSDYDPLREMLRRCKMSPYEEY
ncbi:MAG: phosphate/phosphite/phosphonate ABC transporter substrate-binding protein [bacterium]